MGGAHFRPTPLALCVLAVIVLAAAGCYMPVRQTQIGVQVAGERLLHLAVVPRVLPDGTLATEQLRALLDEVAERSSGYTYIEQVMAGWRQGEDGRIVDDVNDLLLVAGSPELGFLLRRRLHEEFGQAQPFVVSLPIQSVRIYTPRPSPLPTPPQQ